MTARELEQAVMEAIVDCLAARVVEKLRGSHRSAVVLFTGTEIGLEPALVSIRTLRAAGWSLRFVLSPRAGRILPAGRLREFGADDIVASAPRDEGGEDALLDGSDLVLVPTLSVTVAAKVACCIRDSLASRLLARALERGIEIVAATNGCCPADRERGDKGFDVADAYKARMSANLEALQNYGIRLVRAKALATAVQAGPREVRAASAPTPVPGPVAAEARRVFSRGAAMRCPAGESLRLDADVLVTPLARDELRARNINLIQA